MSAVVSSVVGLVVDTNTMILDRVVIPDTDAGLRNHALKPNEWIIKMPIAVYQSLQSRDDIVAYQMLAG